MMGTKWAATVALLLGVAGCDATATANVPDHLTFSTATPDALTPAAVAALAHLPADTATVEHGIVLSETPDETWYARVLIRGGVAVLTEGGCGDNWQPDNWWRQQVQPGDAIRWSPKGNTVCPDQVVVTGPAAVR